MFFKTCLQTNQDFQNPHGIFRSIFRKVGGVAKLSLESFWRLFWSPRSSHWRLFGNLLRTFWNLFKDLFETFWRLFQNLLATFWKLFVDYSPRGVSNEKKWRIDFCCSRFQVIFPSPPGSLHSFRCEPGGEGNFVSTIFSAQIFCCTQLFPQTVLL